MKEIKNQNDVANATGKNQTGKHANNPIRILTAKSIIGDKVYNNSGEGLGRITDIMLNINDGKIEYVIIVFGGFLGVNQKYFAVPFEALTVNLDHHAFIFDQSRSSFENSPGFDKKHWPDANFHAQYSGEYGGFMGVNTGTDH